MLINEAAPEPKHGYETDGYERNEATTMDTPPSAFEDKSTREVLHELVGTVVKSDDEMSDKSTRGGDQTDLNVYLCDNHGFEIGEIDHWVTRLATDDTITGHTESYVDEHTVSEVVADDHVSVVTITTPAKNREDEFVFVTNEGYLWVLTTVHSDWREKTIENFLNYLPCVERLYLSSEDLERLSDGIADSRVSGFTAKYHTPGRRRDATLQFSGAETDDLRKAEETFGAKPTRIEFDQTNSPTTAIQGANNNDGRLTIQSVRDGSQEKAVETLLGLTREYQSLDESSFEVHSSPRIDRAGSGYTLSGTTAVELVEPDRSDVSDGELVAELTERVLNGSRYSYAERDSGRKLRVFDGECDETFDIAPEAPDIVLYARETTTALSLRAFVKRVYEHLDSTYRLRKSETVVADT